MVLVFLMIIIVIVVIVFCYYFFSSSQLHLQNKAEKLILADKIDEAIVEYQKILAKRPFDNRVLFKISDLYFKRNKIDQAVACLEKITYANRYGEEVEKFDVFTSLAKMYFKRGEQDKAFSLYFEILKDYPNDIDSLYYVGFIALGHEFFDLAYSNFEKLINLGQKDFKIFFGAGVAALQCQKITESIALFKNALDVEPYSEIANIAMIFSLNKKMDYKSSKNFAEIVIENSEDETARFIARRLLAFSYIELNNLFWAVKVFEELKDYCIFKNLEDELKIVLYDLGFVNLINENTDQTYYCWNQLYEKDKGFRNIQDLLVRLKKGMNGNIERHVEPITSVLEEVDTWRENFFPENFIWNICGLKSEKKFDIQSIISSSKSFSGRSRKMNDSTKSLSDFANLEKIYKLDGEKFRTVAYKMSEKLGLIIDEVLSTYREDDGVDFIAHSKDTGSKTLVWVRRWKGASVGEITIRNFAQAINDLKAKQGYFITTTNLSVAGEGALPYLNAVTVIPPEEVVVLTKGLL